MNRTTLGIAVACIGLAIGGCNNPGNSPSGGAAAPGTPSTAPSPEKPATVNNPPAPAPAHTAAMPPAASGTAQNPPPASTAAGH